MIESGEIKISKLKTQKSQVHKLNFLFPFTDQLHFISSYVRLHNQKSIINTSSYSVQNIIEEQTRLLPFISNLPVKTFILTEMELIGTVNRQ